jgi:hypothetical protein
MQMEIDIVTSTKYVGRHQSSTTKVQIYLKGAHAARIFESAVILRIANLKGHVTLLRTSNISDLYGVRYEGSDNQRDPNHWNHFCDPSAVLFSGLVSQRRLDSTHATSFPHYGAPSRPICRYRDTLAPPIPRLSGTRHECFHLDIYQVLTMPNGREHYSVLPHIVFSYQHAFTLI